MFLPEQSFIKIWTAARFPFHSKQALLINPICLVFSPVLHTARVGDIIILQEICPAKHRPRPVVTATAHEGHLGWSGPHLGLLAQSLQGRGRETLPFSHVAFNSFYCLNN